MPCHQRRGRRAHGRHPLVLAPGTDALPPDAIAARLRREIRKVSCVHGEAAPRNLELEAHRGHVVSPGLLLVRVDVERRVVGRRVDAYRTTALVGSPSEGRVPRERSFRRTSDRLALGDRPSSTERRIDAVEDLAVVIRFLRGGRVVREAMFSYSKLVIRNLRIARRSAPCCRSSVRKDLRTKSRIGDASTRALRL